MKPNVRNIRRAILLSLIALLASVAHGEQIAITAQPGLVELKLTDPIFSGADISWEAKQPLTLPFKGPYDGGTTIVFHASTAGQYVVVADVIDWEAKKRTKTQWVVTVEGPPPNPPKPPQPPTPPKPRPEGLAGEVYDRALAIGNPSVAINYSARLDSVTSQIGAGALTTVPEVMGALRSALTGVAPGDPKWVEFGQWISTIRFGTTAQAKTTIEAVSLGLRKAGGQ